MANYRTAAERELVFPGTLAKSSRGAGVKRLQEWLSLAGYRTAVDGDFGDATLKQLNAFQAASGLPVSGKLAQAAWDALTAPLARAIDQTTITASGTIGATTLKVARQHLKEHPQEIGGPNAGPWVRAYMDGNEGVDWPWCAGFVTFVLAQACSSMQVATPLMRTYSCDSLAMDGRAKKCFVPGKQLQDAQRKWSDLGSCQIFLVRKSPNDWSHTGFAFGGEGTVFNTIEGNTNDSGSREGFEVCKRVRSIADKDFVVLG